jgi:hypothetical protein
VAQQARKGDLQVARRPNYGQERAERQRRKAARRDERLAAKTERRDKGLPSDVTVALASESQPPSGAEGPGAAMPDDPVAMIRLGKALTFVCGTDHPTTLAVQRAAISADSNDIDRARALFLQLTPGSQHAALTIAAAAPAALR